MSVSNVRSPSSSAAAWTAQFNKVSAEAAPSKAELQQLADSYSKVFGKSADPAIQKLLTDAANNPQNAKSDLGQVDKLAQSEYGSQSADGVNGTDGHSAPATPQRQS